MSSRGCNLRHHHTFLLHGYTSLFSNVNGHKNHLEWGWRIACENVHVEILNGQGMGLGPK